MLHIFNSSFSYVLIMIKHHEVPLLSMTIYRVIQKQHRIKKITHTHKLCFNIIYSLCTACETKSLLETLSFQKLGFSIISIDCISLHI